MICNIIDIDETIKDQLKKALESDDLHAVHMFTGDALRLIEIKTKIFGRIQTSAQINVANQLNIYDSPLWLGVGWVLAEILAPYPDLRAKVATALIELEGAHV